jgi:Ca2+/Na+ antiporter
MCVIPRPINCGQSLFSELNMSEDVVGATFMATAVSSPDLFINIVGTFITEGDIGVGTVVGSSVFNGLAVPAFCGLFAKQVYVILKYIYVQNI